MKQPGFPVQGFARRSKRTTRREQFLTEMEAVVPWGPLCERIEPFYPKAGNGRQPYPLPTILRIYFLQHWFNYADEAMEDALYEMPLLSRFAGIDLGEDAIPDAGTIVDATLIRAPPSTKNRDRMHDPDMSQTKKANQYGTSG